MHPTTLPLLPTSSRTAPPCSPSPRRSPRDGSGPDHHLWRNGRLWWIAVTVYDTVRGERVRVRRSLHTRDVLVARRLRDAFLARARQSARFELAIRGPAARAPARAPVAAAG